MNYPGLQKAMKENGENCTSLCKLLRLPNCSISLRMHGRTEFRISEIEAIMNHYKRSYEELFR